MAAHGSTKPPACIICESRKTRERACHRSIHKAPVAHRQLDGEHPEERAPLRDGAHMVVPNLRVDGGVRMPHVDQVQMLRHTTTTHG